MSDRRSKRLRRRSYFHQRQSVRRGRRAGVILAAVTAGALLGSASPASAAGIYRWIPSYSLIPGTASITPAPGIDLSNWNTTSHNLNYANLVSIDLHGANFNSSWLNSARFTSANLSSVSFVGTSLTGGNLNNANLTMAWLCSTSLNYGQARNADFTGANLRAANLTGTYASSANLTSADLSTANLNGTDISSANLIGADLSGANLSRANLVSTNLTSANLTGAVINSVNFWATTSSGLTAAQFYTTANYQARDLTGIWLSNNDLSGWNLTNQNLNSVTFWSANLTSTNLMGAQVTGVDFSYASGFTADQLYSTASYQARNLTGLWLLYQNLSGWNLASQNLYSTSLSGANLTSADLTGATVAYVNFEGTTSSGLTAAQIYSTASYQAGLLPGIGLGENDLSGWNLAGQKLMSAGFWLANLAGANLRGADLTGAYCSSANLTSTDLSASTLHSVALASANLTAANLANASLMWSDLTKSNLSAANLTSAVLWQTDLTGTNLKGSNLNLVSWAGARLDFSDLRGATDFGGAADAASKRGMINPDGAVAGLYLMGGEIWLIRPNSLKVKVTGGISLSGTTDAWTSKIDLNDDKLVIDRSTSGTTLTSYLAALNQIKTGYHNGAWDGQGISSSTAKAEVGDPLHPWPKGLGVINNDDGTGNPRYYGDGTPATGGLPTFGGWAVDGTSVLIAYTWLGDCNLDGVVDDSDLALLNGGLAAPPGTLTGWVNGDFDYSGAIDGRDVELYWAGRNQTAVPEPGSLALIALAAGMVGMRRRK